MSASKQMMEQLFNMKFASKQLQRNSKKCEKDEKRERDKLKKAIEKGNIDGARIHASNAIRLKNESLNFLRMASRVDAVVSKLDAAVRMNQVTKAMAGVTKAMGQTLKSMDLEKLTGTMEKFEAQFEDLDVRSEYVEGTMTNTTALSTPEDQVESLMHQVADEHGLELRMGLQDAPEGVRTANPETDLEARLAKLKE